MLCSGLRVLSIPVSQAACPDQGVSSSGRHIFSTARGDRSGEAQLLIYEMVEAPGSECFAAILHKYLLLFIQ